MIYLNRFINQSVIPAFYPYTRFKIKTFYMFLSRRQVKRPHVFSSYIHTQRVQQAKKSFNKARQKREKKLLILPGFIWIVLGIRCHLVDMVFYLLFSFSSYRSVRLFLSNVTVPDFLERFKSSRSKSPTITISILGLHSAIIPSLGNEKSEGVKIAD